jgi:ankyrin repeat protein
MKTRAVLASLVLGLYAAFALPAENTLGKNEQPIHDAARIGKRADVEKILKENPAARDLKSELGSTPLHYAALNEDAGPLKALIAAGANVNARDKEGNTPLHMAAYATRKEHVQALLQAGADPNAKTEAGRDVLSLARKVRADEVAGIISLWLLKGCKAGKPC